MREISCHAVRRIPLRVHRDHEDLYLLCRFRSQSLQGLRDLRQGRRTYAWARGISEIEHDEFALKVTETDGLVGMPCQRKVDRTWLRLADDAMKDVRQFVCEPL